MICAVCHVIALRHDLGSYHVIALRHDLGSVSCYSIVS